jgi:hypothetical protein
MAPDSTQTAKTVVRPQLLKNRGTSPITRPNYSSWLFSRPVAALDATGLLTAR